MRLHPQGVRRIRSAPSSRTAALPRRCAPRNDIEGRLCIVGRCLHAAGTCPRPTGDAAFLEMPRATGSIVKSAEDVDRAGADAEFPAFVEGIEIQVDLIALDRAAGILRGAVAIDILTVI